MGAHERQGPRATKNKARLNRYEALLAEERNVKLDAGPDPHPGRPAAGRRRSSRPTVCARASATGC